MNLDKGNSGDGDSDAAVPKAVVSRLSLYLRELQQLVRDGQETTNSTQLGKLLGFTDAQIRKDLAYFGQFGYPGIGYRCEELINEIKRILGHIFDTKVDLASVDLVTVTRVELSPDLKNASVYLSLLNPKPNAISIIRKILKRKRMLRYQMGTELQIKYVPHLKIFLDEAIEQSARIHAILEDLHHDSPDDRSE